MQISAQRNPIAERLIERSFENHRLVVASVARLADVRGTARDIRARSQSLRQQVREQLDTLRAGLASTKGWYAAHPVPRLFGRMPHLSPPTLDPVDAGRRELHDHYATNGDQATRSELMSSYDGFARSLALQFRHRDSVDDLIQVARIGLLHAIDRFDPNLGRPFPLFARITITGELKRHIRDKTWSMRVPRSLQEDYLSVMRAVEELTGEQSESPSLEAVAVRCDLTVDRVLEAMELRMSQKALSIDTPAGVDADDPVFELGQEESGFRRLENRELVGHLLARLPERDRRIVELRFINEMTQSEIAAEVGVSQMCVSRVLARTLGRLRLWARAAAGE